MSAGTFRWFCISLMVCAASTAAVANVATCMHQAPRWIFYQPWNSHENRADQIGAVLARQLSQQGFTHLILQWSRHGNTVLWPENGQGWVRRSLPRHERLRVIHGLYAEPQFFEALKLDDNRLEALLAVIRHRSRLEAIKILKLQHGKIAGWYLPEEIDDLNWQSPNRQKMLADHFRQMVFDLNALRPNIPVYATAFFGGHGQARTFAQMLRLMHDKTAVIWLIQDGQGTLHQNKPNTASYLSAIAKALPAQAWHGVLEIYTEKDPDPGTDKANDFCAASAAEIGARKQLWCMATGRSPEVVFSLAQGQWGALTFPEHCHSEDSDPRADLLRLR